MELQLSTDSRLLRIFIGENDKFNHKPLYEALVFAAQEEGLAGATVLRGILSFGAGSRIHSAKLIEISQDLPLVIEIVDLEEKVNAFVKIARSYMDQAECGGLITIERIQVLYHQSGKG